MSQITIRSLPEPVESAIRGLAAERRISLSAATNLLIERALGLESNGQGKRDLSVVFGSWDQKEFEEFAAHTRQIDQIDDEIWT